MKVIIDIPDDEYRWIKKSDKTVFADVASKECMMHAIKNGTPLPKGHGRLIDENELIDEIVCEEIDGIYHDVIYAHSIYDTNTVIEAESGVNE